VGELAGDALVASFSASSYALPGNGSGDPPDAAGARLDVETHCTALSRRMSSG
jgi:hypothetical protein